MKIKDIKEILMGDEDFPYKDEDEVIVKKVFVFSNGNVAVTNQHGKQIPFLQGLLSGAEFKIQ